MITILCTNAFKGARAVYSPASRLPKHLKTLPVLSHMKLYTHEGRVALTQMVWDEKKQELIPHTEHISARIDTAFETCVPAKPFMDWLRATLPDKHDKAVHASEQIELTLDTMTQRLKIKAGNTRAEFKCLDALEFPLC